MRSVLSIEVQAPAARVFALVHEPERWAAILPHYRSVRVLARGQTTDGTARVLARYVAVRAAGPGGVFAVPVVWRSWSSSDPHGVSLRFRHAGGPTTGMEVTWRIEAKGSGCRVSIEHVFRRRLPIPILGRLLGDEAFPRLVDTLIVRPVAGRTLEAVRTIAEAVEHAESARLSTPYGKP